MLGDWTVDWAAAHAGGNVSVGGRQLTPRVLTSTGALEIAVHGWDVSVACGAERPLPASLALELLQLAPRLVAPMDRPSRFGQPLPVAPSAPPGVRLLAFLGRRAGVNHPSA
jgi:uncharacterized protein (TIGR03086 family)